jgi:hypothetical protein
MAVPLRAVPAGWLVDSVLGNADVAFLCEVCLRGKHDIYVMGVEEHFEFISVLYVAVGVPDGKFQEFCHYVSLARTVVRRFNIDPSWSKRPFIIILSS